MALKDYRVSSVASKAVRLVVAAAAGSDFSLVMVRFRCIKFRETEMKRDVGITDLCTVRRKPSLILSPCVPWCYQNRCGQQLDFDVVQTETFPWAARTAGSAHG